MLTRRARPTDRPAGFLSRLAQDRRGVAAIEFALVAPIMFVMYFGVAEVCTVLTCQRRTAHAAGAIGDLGAQVGALYDSDVSDIFSVASTVLQPYDYTPLQLRLTSVTMDANSVARVDWSDVKTSTQPDLPLLACNASVTNLPANLLTSPGDNVVMAEAVYNYTSPIGYSMTKAFSFKPRYFTRPRTAAKVSRYVGGSASTTPKCP